jgi:hypothetical protein
MLATRKDSIKPVFIHYTGHYTVSLTKLDKGNYRVIIEKKKTHKKCRWRRRLQKQPCTSRTLPCMGCAVSSHAQTKISKDNIEAARRKYLPAW